MTVSYALTTTAKVKAHLGISVSTYDTVIDTIVNWTTDFIEGYVGKRFKETTYTQEEYDGGVHCLFLKNYPVTTLSAFEYAQGLPSSPTWTAFSANDYKLYGNEGYIKSLAGTFANGSRNLRATYTAGYKIDFANELTSTHTLPFDVTMVATQLSAKIFDKRFSEGKSSENVEGQSINWMSELTPEQKSVLGKYQKNLV